MKKSEKWNVILTNKVTGEETIYETCNNKSSAETICEMWGWNFDDNGKTYWMGYEKA